MPGACLSLWPTEECQWSLWDIWRRSDIVERAIYFSLALMLGYTLFVLLRFFLRNYLASRESRDFKTDSPEIRRVYTKLVADLYPGVGMLRGISWAAPFLGLAGLCYGILAGFSKGVSGEWASALGYVVWIIVDASFATVAGIVVAIPAAFSHGLIRARLEALSGQLLPKRHLHSNDLGAFHFAQTLLLKRRFSVLPPYALLAAPFLALAVMPYMATRLYGPPTGLPITVAIDHCQPGVADRVIVLQVTEKGQLFINTEPVSWTEVSRRLSDIYNTRSSRELYLRADDGAYFQTVADAIDIVRNVRNAKFNTRVDINVVLITPAAVAERQKCIGLIWDPVRRRALKMLK